MNINLEYYDNNLKRLRYYLSVTNPPCILKLLCDDIVLQNRIINDLNTECKLAEEFDPLVNEYNGNFDQYLKNIYLLAANKKLFVKNCEYIASLDEGKSKFGSGTKLFTYHVIMNREKIWDMNAYLILCINKKILNDCHRNFIDIGITIDFNDCLINGKSSVSKSK